MIAKAAAQTSFTIEIAKEGERVFAVSLGCSASGSYTDKAIDGLLRALGAKHDALKSANRYGSLSELGKKDLQVLEGIFNPHEEHKTPELFQIKK